MRLRRAHSTASSATINQYTQPALCRAMRLLTISEIVGSYKEIQEIDLNPVIAYEKGLAIADARILLKKDEDFTDW